IAAGIYHSETQATGDGYRDRALGRGPVPKLTPDVITPTIRDAMGGHAARMDVAGAHRGETVHANDTSGGRPVHGVVDGPGAKLTATLVAPAGGRAPGDHAAGVRLPGADDADAEPAHDGHRHRRPGGGRAARLASALRA